MSLFDMLSQMGHQQAQNQQPQQQQPQMDGGMQQDSPFHQLMSMFHPANQAQPQQPMPTQPNAMAAPPVATAPDAGQAMQSLGGGGGGKDHKSVFMQLLKLFGA